MAAPGVSDAFQAFLTEAPDHARAWLGGVQGLEGASALDPKTAALAYLAVLSALGLLGGVPFHAREAKRAGASRDEVKSAVLLGLPATGMRAIQALPDAIAAFDAAD